MQAERILTEHRRFLGTLDRPEQTQHEVLTGILRENAGTDYGRTHDLPTVRTADEYRRAVPIRTHLEFMPWIERMMAGERGVLTVEEPVAYVSSSGSTGQEKHVPYPPSFLRRCFLPFYHASFAVLLRSMPEVLAAPEGVLNLWQDPTAPRGQTRHGQPHIGISQIDFARFGDEDGGGAGDESGAAAGAGPGGGAAADRIPEALAGADPWERAYHRLRLAAERDVRLLIAVNPALVAGLPYLLREHWPRLVDDIRAGTLGGVPHTAPNRERADEIARYAKTFGTVHPYHLWPRLAAIVAWNSALASLYLPRVRELYGPGVQLFAAPIGSSEGPVAAPVDRHPTGAPLYLPGCFFEFVPADRPIAADAQTLLAAELEEGRDYHLVLSHIGGLYRCAVTDLVRVLGHVGRTPRIEYAGRSVVRSSAGVRLSEPAVVRALRAATADTGAELRNATVNLAADRYQVAVAGIVPEGFAAALDDRLGETCDGYRVARESGSLGRVEVVPVHPDAFLREWERTIRAGQRANRVKDRILAPTEEMWERITAEGGAYA
jgi:GH3 auxin-responsive promoter